MEHKEAGETSQGHKLKLPFLNNTSAPEADRNTKAHKAVNNTCKSTAGLAKHLPTGTVLVYQLLSPISTNQGKCSSLNKYLTAGLMSLCALSCIILSFTDSFKDKKGNVFHGFATFRGFFVIDGSAKMSPEFVARYKLRAMDFVHAFLTVLVFASVALFDDQVLSCFFSKQSGQNHLILKAVPLGISTICSGLFAVFPSQRQGIGFSASAD